MADDLGGFPFDWIARDLRAGNCIPFLGAGASAFPTAIESKPPSANQLARELAGESQFPPYQTFADTAGNVDASALERHLRAQLDCENLMLVSSWVEYGIGDRRRLRDKLRQHLANKDRPLPCNGLHELLARTAKQTPMAIITTNYDDLVEQALTKYEVPFDLFVIAIDRNDAAAQVHGTMLFRPDGEDKMKPVTGEKEILGFEDAVDEIRLKRTVVFKIHGHIGRIDRTNDTFVITEEDYVSFLGRMGTVNSVIPADLVTLMQSRTLLFLGYGLRDWNFRVLLDRLNRMREQAIKSYAIAMGITDAERRLWITRGVEVFNADLNEFVPRLEAELSRASVATP
jgi:hypothetical protein